MTVLNISLFVFCRTYHTCMATSSTATFTTVEQVVVKIKDFPNSDHQSDTCTSKKYNWVQKARALCEYRGLINKQM